ncbi:MAG: hypothetical protein ABS54_00450 [Hyphomicrobium sp. SCN 65-11]|nr:MAG: hypothetical protein ABS54_00450 [Hyphomicrobium sp. SCN 65-11]
MPTVLFDHGEPTDGPFQGMTQHMRTHETRVQLLVPAPFQPRALARAPATAPAIDDRSHDQS